MSKRRSVNDKVDQMENTLQNILLQELENFEGIFMATTNLEDNLDPAFDRRLLYKVRMERPTPGIRSILWEQKLPGLHECLRREVSTAYDLSGGQIDNICKKIMTESLLDEQFDITRDYLRSLIEQETSLQDRDAKKRHPIGFLRSTG
jgi:SpoVK/Ycf46/Vps4 family AAA+-type ATPase